MYDSSAMIVDSGCIREDTLRGGRVGVFMHQQKDVRWSNMETRCITKDEAQDKLQCSD